MTAGLALLRQLIAGTAAWLRTAAGAVHAVVPASGLPGDPPAGSAWPPHIAGDQRSHGRGMQGDPCGYWPPDGRK